MHRHFLLLIAALGFTASISAASDFTAKVGHYESAEHESPHVSFYLASDGEIRHFKINHNYVWLRHTFAGKSHSFDKELHFAFHRRYSENNLNTATGTYSAQGHWTKDDVCKGDFRHYLTALDFNTYHVWKAHWARN